VIGPQKQPPKASRRKLGRTIHKLVKDNVTLSKYCDQLHERVERAYREAEAGVTHFWGRKRRLAKVMMELGPYLVDKETPNDEPATEVPSP